jgi:short-subunit dehydrogenase
LVLWMIQMAMSSRPPLVFITGASSGIGQALAACYAHQGYRLALVARRTAALQSWVQSLPVVPTQCVVYGADVQDLRALAAATQACIQNQGVPDVVIANAGISVGMDTVIAADLEVMRQVLQTNVLGVAATFQPFVAAMRKRGSGRLVGIASVAGIRGLPGHGAYCASKAAVISYCESLRGELRGSGVRVVTISPGYIDTPLTRENRYSMPFLMSAQDFAKRAFKAIQQGRSHRVLPWQMAWVAWLLRMLPNGVFDYLAAGQPRKHRQLP